MQRREQREVRRLVPGLPPLRFRRRPRRRRRRRPRRLPSPGGRRLGAFPALLRRGGFFEDDDVLGVAAGVVAFAPRDGGGGSRGALLRLLLRALARLFRRRARLRRVPLGGVLSELRLRGGVGGCASMYLRNRPSVFGPTPWTALACSRWRTRVGSLHNDHATLPSAMDHVVSSPAFSTAAPWSFSKNSAYSTFAGCAHRRRISASESRSARASRMHLAVSFSRAARAPDIDTSRRTRGHGRGREGDRETREARDAATERSDPRDDARRGRTRAGASPRESPRRAARGGVSPTRRPRRRRATARFARF